MWPYSLVFLCDVSRGGSSHVACITQVHPDMEHAEGACEPGCTERHRFCTVKLAVPQKGRPAVPVLMWIDLAPQLQAASFAAFLRHTADVRCPRLCVYGCRANPQF